ncbi:ATP-grasp fold amidoligase family protein [Vibrio splendidus]|uniref:ATP-grasp fold amidoligase family protein n=1 Tax=Vibrio splendidus TaxID=29497 RepID=UPI00352F0924
MSKIKSLTSRFKKLKPYLLTDKYYLATVFKHTFNRKVNFNDPLTLNEKLQWLKINDRRDLLTRCSDKIAVRDYITDKIGSSFLIPLEGVFERVEDITMESLPDYPFIIKANHTSGTFKIIRDKKNIDIVELQKECQLWLRKNYYIRTKEWQYKNIKPKILVEKLLLDEKGNIPSDLKFSCINGLVEMIHVDSNKEIKHLRNHYDSNWKHLNFRWPEEYFPGEITNKPDRLNELIELSEKLAVDFPFVRVDFYCLNDRIYFGELTFHPTSGFGKFYPEKYDYIYGRLLRVKYD